MEEKEKKGTSVVTIILLILVIALSGYIVYDKDIIGLKSKEKNNNTEEKEQETEKIFDITYKEETYNLESKNGEYSIKNKRNLPVITSKSNQTAADNIVSEMKKISDERWENIKQTANESTELDGISTDIGVEEITKTIENNKNYISFLTETSGSFGGVSWTNNFGITFDSKTGKKLEVKDITNNEEKLTEIVIEYVKNSLKNEFEKAEESILSQGWEDIVENNIYKNWYLEKDNIVFVFEKYSIGPGAIGSPIIKLPKTQVSDYLLENYK